MDVIFIAFFGFGLMLKAKKTNCSILFRKKALTFAAQRNTEVVAQLVRAPVCGTGGRGFETHLSPSFFSK